MKTKADIIVLPDPRLHQKSKRVGHVDESVRRLAEDMISATVDWDADREHEITAALAAVQIGVMDRVVIVRRDFEDKEDHVYDVFINPEIIKGEGDLVEDMEGCLSVHRIYGVVARYPKVKIKALNLDGKPVRLTATGFLARVFQHEIDHTNGVVFVDHITDVTQLYHLEANGEFSPLNPPADD